MYTKSFECIYIYFGMSNSNNHFSDNQVSVATFSVVIFYNLRFTEALKLHTEDQIWNQKPEISTWSQKFLVKSERVSEEISGVSTLICDFRFAKIMESKIRELSSYILIHSMWMCLRNLAVVENILTHEQNDLNIGFFAERNWKIKSLKWSSHY